MRQPLPTVREHLAALVPAVRALEGQIERIEAWGLEVARVLTAGGRLLAAGNGGSAAQAQHLTSELVGRFRDDRAPLSAIALHADSSTTTAIVNDYGADALFARQVRAHGRPGDVLVLLSTSGRSPNLIRAAQDARALRLKTLAITGPVPNPLAATARETVAIAAASTATVQEIHQVVVHLLALAVERQIVARPATLSEAAAG